MSTVKVVNLRDFAKTIGAEGERQLAAVKKATLLGIARSVPMLVDKSPVDTGLYAASWDFSEMEFGAVLGNYAPHAPIIEHGARPFTPPLGPLLAWAKRVLKDDSQPPGYSDRVWALAKATQRKIAAEGMQPRHILENAIPEILDNIRKEFEAIVSK
jgi:hypothetical protein